MILDEQGILDIINNQPYGEVIADAQEQYKKLYMHYTGEGVEDYIDDIDEFFRENTKETLVKLIRSNKDMIARVMNPRNKIYTAKGGMEQYNLPDDLKNDFSIFLSRVADGLPICEWIRQRVQCHYDYDPNGLVQIEINADNLPYPKIRCINDIYEYMPNGRALEYVIFNVTPDEKQAYIANGTIPANTPNKCKIYRVIDDTTDRVVITEGSKKITIASEIENEFGYVPCIIISDIWGCEMPQKMDSPLSVSINLLDDMLLDSGLFKWAYMRGVFPKEWMQRFGCPTCEGKTEINGQDCPECKGLGYLPYMRTADVAVVDYRNDENKSIPNPPIGRIDSDIAALQFMKDNGMSIEDYFNWTIWDVTKTLPSTKGDAKPAGKGSNVSATAYEANLNNQGKQDRQLLFGSWKVSIQRFIADCCGWYIYREAYEGSAIIQGDRMLNESSDATWQRYLTAVQGMAPMFALDSLLTEFNENKYAGNPEMFRRAELMRQVEPFVHEPVNIIWLDPQLPLTARLMKKYFDEWTSTITDYDVASLPDEGGAEILRGMLSEYVMGKYMSDYKMDALLMNAVGGVIEIGTQVKLIHGKAKKPEHQGQTYTIADITGRDITLRGGTDKMDAVFGYNITDVYTIQKQIAA